MKWWFFGLGSIDQLEHVLSTTVPSERGVWACSV